MGLIENENDAMWGQTGQSLRKSMFRGALKQIVVKADQTALK